MWKLREAVIFSLGLQENSDVREEGDAWARQCVRDCFGVAGGGGGGLTRVASFFIFSSSWDLRGLGVVVPCHCRPLCEIPTQLADLDARNMLPSVILPAGNDGVEVRGFTQRRVEDGGQPFDHGGHWWIDSSVFAFLEVPLSATFFGGEQGEPLNPLAVVRKRVAFACDDGVCFHFFSVLETQGFSSAGQANMVQKNVKALPAPDSKTAWVSAPLGALADAGSRLKTY